MTKISAAKLMQVADEFQNMLVDVHSTGLAGFKHPSETEYIYFLKGSLPSLQFVHGDHSICFLSFFFAIDSLGLQYTVNF